MHPQPPISYTRPRSGVWVPHEAYQAGRSLVRVIQHRADDCALVICPTYTHRLRNRPTAWYTVQFWAPAPVWSPARLLLLSTTHLLSMQNELARHRECSRQCRPTSSPAHVPSPSVLRGIPRLPRVYDASCLKKLSSFAWRTT